MAMTTEDALRARLRSQARDRDKMLTAMGETNWARLRECAALRECLKQCVIKREALARENAALRAEVQRLGGEQAEEGGI